MPARATAVLLVVLALALPAFAKKPVDPAVKHGDAIKTAHKKNDVLAEWKAWEALREFLVKQTDPGASRKAIITIMGRIDAKRAGAFASAHSLAREILFMATATGDRDGVPAAAAVLEKFARNSKTKKRGKAAQVMADYGKALVETDPAESAKLLDAVLTVACDERWYETATLASIELAVLHLAAKKPDLAKSAFERAARANEGYPDRNVLIGWANATGKRLKDAPKEVVAPVYKAVHALKGGGQKGADGGAGRGGNTPKTRLHPLWKKLKPKSVLMSVRRTPEGAKACPRYLGTGEQSFRFRTGTRHLEIDAIGLAFHGHAVALVHIDPAGRTPIMSDGPIRELHQAWYMLARGETWELRRDGAVVIRPPKKNRK